MAAPRASKKFHEEFDDINVFWDYISEAVRTTSKDPHFNTLPHLVLSQDIFDYLPKHFDSEGVKSYYERLINDLHYYFTNSTFPFNKLAISINLPTGLTYELTRESWPAAGPRLARELFPENAVHRFPHLFNAPPAPRSAVKKTAVPRLQTGSEQKKVATRQAGAGASAEVNERKLFIDIDLSEDSLGAGGTSKVASTPTPPHTPDEKGSASPSTHFGISGIYGGKLIEERAVDEIKEKKKALPKTPPNTPTSKRR